MTRDFTPNGTHLDPDELVDEIQAMIVRRRAGSSTAA